MTNVAYRSFVCSICGFIYNEEHGMPEEGIAPGTRWADVPDTWYCPQCGTEKAGFDMREQV